jgi:anaerobic selenocysteine-containing dehydrogenase
MKRRHFLILTGVGATGASLLSACGHPENRLIPALVPDGEYVPGIDYWKASGCAMCDAGCGILVRTRERKANKIEGNPSHPVNRGALCARGQAALQLLYNPDRLRSPLKRTGERGSGEFAEIGWDEAIKTLAEILGEIKRAARAGSVFYLSVDRMAVNRLAAEHFLSAYGSTALLDASIASERQASSSYAASYNTTGLPIFDIANATYLISFGARFLETWHSPVMYSLAYGEFRRSAGKARGRFVHVEPRMSLTAANADVWLPARPASEGALALAIAQVITRERLIANISTGAPPAPLDEYAPEKVAERVDIPAEKIIAIAREFAASPRPLAIGAGAGVVNAGGIDGMAGVNYLNMLVGNINKPGGVLLNQTDSSGPIDRMRPARRLKSLPLSRETIKDAAALLVHGANPIYTGAVRSDDLTAAPFIASFSSFMDETTNFADLVLPDHTFLEGWDIRAARSPARESTFTLTRPVVEPEFNTMQTADVFIALARELGVRMPFDSAEQAVKQIASELDDSVESAAPDESEESWNRLLERGLWSGKPALAEERAGTDLRSLASLQDGVQPEASSESEYPFELLAYEHPVLGFGETANLPWLQELPDPMTSVMWGSWVEINPATAASLGISDGDLLEVTTASGSVRAPAVIYPAIRPDVVAMPYGQGHTAYGRYASEKGASAYKVAPFPPLDGPLAPARAKIAKLDEKVSIIRFGSSIDAEAGHKR